jgi:drug/metabolite transporter (DMT)-like permease
MLGVVILWGINVSVMKLAMNEVSPLVFNALRFPLGAAVLILIMWRYERDFLPSRNEWLPLFLLGLIAHPIYQIFFLGGLSITSASHTAVLISTTPIWVALGDHFHLKERLPAPAWAGIILSLSGVLILTVARGEGATESSLIGDGMVLIAGFLWAVYSVFSRPLLKRRSAVWVTSWAVFFGTPFIIALGIPGLLSLKWESLTVVTWGGAVYAGLFALATAYTLWAVGIKVLGASRAAIFANAIPVVALTVAWIWLGELLPPLAWVGAGITVFGIWITTTTHSHDPRRLSTGGRAATT